MDDHRAGGEEAAFINIDPDAAGRCVCGIANPNLGIATLLRFEKNQLPWLTNWQHWGPGEYVTGLEPGTNVPTGQVAARNDNTLMSYETDWKAVIARDDIDAIDICTPNDMHAEISIAAAKAGKMIFCEKPLARTLEESEEMVNVVETTGVKNMVWYNYRRLPAVTLAKHIIDSGKLGKIFHYRANFL